MRQKSNSNPASYETLVRDVRRATRKHHAAEEKIRIVLDGLRGETSIAELCRREGIAESMYYSWSKEFLEAGKRRLAGDTARAATTDEVKQLRREAQDFEGGRKAGLLERIYKGGKTRRGGTSNRYKFNLDLVAAEPPGQVVRDNDLVAREPSTQWHASARPSGTPATQSSNDHLNDHLI